MHNSLRFLAFSVLLPFSVLPAHAQTDPVGVPAPGAGVVLIVPIAPPAAAFVQAPVLSANGMASKFGSDGFLSAMQKKMKDDLAAARKKTSAAPKKPQPGPSPYTDSEIIDMAKHLAQQYKGSPWSYTEYNSVLYPTLDHLRQQGVPERQIALYKKTCEEFPGRPFNPWSGD